ncbi:superoxide dismutase [Cu-Zn] SodC2 [Hyphomicrobium methylovorum]|uniref:superoxide dismutase family protein n=1 Tax=Hyphomicrobium methylovorum TaxID=84 RepID=UPI0015E70AEC|nr:superoxide dismutase family protein [Hyphomicrobium methylovorum]MBA2127629.1 superoxide dismutase [Cu-Zn] SodC2 [Hyphomicrobium methylovorum]
MKTPMLVTAALLSGAALATAAYAAPVSVDIHAISAAGTGDKIGTVEISEKSGGGLEFKVDLTGIAPGEHGFHVHTNGDCSAAEKDGKTVPGLAAGGHYDPDGHKSHKGPAGAGHKGDLPFLIATDKGVNVVVSVQDLKLSDVLGRALVVHEGGDNYTDHPENGGGKGRIACGVIPKG